MIEQDLLKEIMQDTLTNGKFTKFYEMLQDELECYSDKRIEKIKETLKFVYPKLTKEIDSYDKMKALYEYSMLI